MKKMLQQTTLLTLVSLFLLSTLFAQEADTLAPVIVSGPDVENILATSVTVQFETDELSTAFINYGKGKNLTKTVNSDSAFLKHSFVLSNLEPETIYLYEVGVTDINGNGPFVTDIDSFKTEELEEVKYPFICIEPQSAELMVGDSLVLAVVYWASDSIQIDTTAVWSLVPDSLATIDFNGVFIAEAPGECIVQADLDSLSAWMSVIIDTDEDDDLESNNHLVVVPRDTVITIGMQIQFEAYMPSDSTCIGERIDSLVIWTLQGMPAGEIDNDGLFTATDVGFVIVTAQYEDQVGTAFVVVSDSTIDTTINSITITRSSPNPDGYSVMKELSEGEIWMLSGLPQPLNILNGSCVYFPIGSLVEDIRIHIDLPGFAVSGPDGINFDLNGVVGGIDFKVMVNDTIKEPYYFETPLIVGVVYKRGLLTHLGIDPLTLNLYFAFSEDDSVMFDTTGIGYTTLDLTQNKIISSVAHFSSLAVMGETGSAVGIDNEAVVLSDYRLYQNYPNPFNPTTVIAYNIPEKTYVNITIYDILGRQIRTLVNQNQNAGYQEILWDSKDKFGKTVSAGIYIYQLNTEKFRTTRKMVLVK